MHTASPSTMSATTTTSTLPSSSATGIRPSVGGASTLRRRGGAAILIAAPSLLLLGASIHPAERTDPTEQLNVIAGASGRWLLTHLILLLGATLMGPAIVVAARRLRSAAPGWGVAATCLGSLGASGLVALFSLEGIGAWRLAGLTDRAGAGLALDRLTGAAEVAGAIGLGIALGGVVLGIALVRTGAGPRTAGIGLAVASALLAIGLASDVGAVAALGMAGSTVAYIVQAVGVLRADGPVAAS